MHIRSDFFSMAKTVRYSSLGEDSGAVHTLWVALHGYGQLTPYFIRPLEALAGPGIRVIAPEAPSRFYLSGSSGRVGASWMTKEERIQDIADNINYLDQLLAHILENLEIPNPTIDVLGFSQGAATAARWVSQGKVNPAQLVLWGSDLPTDLNYTTLRQKAGEGMQISYVQGRQDEIVPAERHAAGIAALQAEGLTPKALYHDGGHVLDKDLLLQISAEIKLQNPDPQI